MSAWPSWDWKVSRDLLAVLARDPPVILGAFGILTAVEAAHARRPDLVLRLKLDALVGIGAMVDPTRALRSTGSRGSNRPSPPVTWRCSSTGTAMARSSSTG